MLCRAYVALLAEGVDRNRQPRRWRWLPRQSPSSRRAWIEILNLQNNCKSQRVALLTEGVDRNIPCGSIGQLSFVSPSSRRAWIEIPRRLRRRCSGAASPSSRRAWIEMTYFQRDGYGNYKSPSSRRAWIEILRITAPLCDRTRRPPRGGRG